jgi:pimeloyl-ACP methyl ester carboxylesterase
MKEPVTNMVEQELYVLETGQSTAPTLVFLHGGGVGGWMWEPQVTRLSSEYHCLVPDLPEQGKSGKIGPFSMSDAARRIADLIRTKAHNGKAHVIGLSLGAQTLVELLSRNPELVDHAIVNSASVRAIPGIGLTNMLVKMYSPFKNSEYLIRANMKSLGVPEQYFPQFREETRQITTTALNHVLTANANYRLPPGLDKVISPVLVVIGQKEYKVMYESARDLVHALPNAKGYVAQGRSHNWSLEAPELYTQMIRDWLSDQPLPPELLPLI